MINRVEQSGRQSRFFLATPRTEMVTSVNFTFDCIEKLHLKIYKLKQCEWLASNKQLINEKPIVAPQGARSCKQVSIAMQSEDNVCSIKYKKLHVIFKLLKSMN